MILREVEVTIVMIFLKKLWSIQKLSVSLRQEEE